MRKRRNPVADPQRLPGATAPTLPARLSTDDRDMGVKSESSL
jgi:hypothetical protein